MLISDFLAYTGTIYADYLISDPRFAEIYIMTKKMIGIMQLVILLLVIVITEKRYSKGEEWSWFALLITGSVVWGTFIVYKFIIGYIGTGMITFFIGFLLTVLGALIPAKEIFSKSSILYNS